MALEQGAQILPEQPATADLAARLGRRHQSALGLRVGPPAAQAGTGLAPLRGPVLDRPTPTRANDLHGVRLSAIPPPRRAAPDGAGKKCRAIFQDRHHRRACRPRAAPSWRGCSPISSRWSAARIAGANSRQYLTSDCPGSIKPSARSRSWAKVASSEASFASASAIWLRNALISASAAFRPWRYRSANSFQRCTSL
jgi:hypothetical protein